MKNSAKCSKENLKWPMRKISKYIISFLLILISGSFFVLKAQDRKTIDKHLQKLTSNSCQGRGYVNKGDEKAAKYLARQFRKYDLIPVSGGYFQSYKMRMNTFPEKPQLKINNNKIKAGSEFVVSASSTKIMGEYKSISLPLNPEQKETDLSQVFLVGNKDYKEFLKDNIYNAKGFVYLDENQPIWSVWPGRDTSSYHVIKVFDEAVPGSFTKIELNIQPEFISDYETQNVWGLLKGKNYPDSIIILGAHYDHLGRFGNTLYPGANDNASGTVMVLELARYFSKPENKPECTILFALFSGEEAGLLGSKYMADNFPFDYSQVKYMINLDMVGAGSQGIKMVNASQFPYIYEKMKRINKEKGYLKAVKSRGESCNSDHCPFYEKGIPAVFIYTLGSETKAYHIPQDNYQSLPLTEFDDLFRLLRDFVEEI